MDKYDKIARNYDLLDFAYFSEKGRNPRAAVMEMLPAGRARVLDLCCGTLSNTLDIALARPELEITGIDRSEGMLRAAEPILLRSIFSVASWKKFYAQLLLALRFSLERFPPTR